MRASRWEALFCEAMRTERWRMQLAARRSIWAMLFVALLTSPFGGYLYVGHLKRGGYFFVVFAVAMATVGLSIDYLGVPMWAADATVAVCYVGSLVDMARIIQRARREVGPEP